MRAPVSFIACTALLLFGLYLHVALGMPPVPWAVWAVGCAALLALWSVNKLPGTGVLTKHASRAAWAALFLALALDTAGLVWGESVHGALRTLFHGCFVIAAWSVPLCTFFVGHLASQEKIPAFQAAMALLALAVHCLALYLQPHIPALMVQALVLLLLACQARKHRLFSFALVGGLAAAAVTLVIEISSRPYLFKRFTSWMTPQADPQGYGAQALLFKKALSESSLVGASKAMPLLPYDLPYGPGINALPNLALLAGVASLGLFFALLALALLPPLMRSIRQGSLTATVLLAYVFLEQLLPIAGFLGLLPITGMGPAFMGSMEKGFVFLLLVGIFGQTPEASDVPCPAASEAGR